MIRAVFTAVAASRSSTINLLNKTLTQNIPRIVQPINNKYHSLAPLPQNTQLCVLPSVQSLLQNEEVQKIMNNINRPLTKFSLRKGKRKSVKAVLKRFYRLDWGIWIRTKSGRHKKLWKKSAARKNRLREHVFVNATQSTLLDKMVTKYWRKPKYYVDDPYEPYHKREEFHFTRKTPL